MARSRRLPDPARAPMRDQAASDVVANMLLIVMAVIMTGALALGVVGQVEPDEGLRSHLTVSANDGTIELVHRGGDPVPLARAHLIVTADGTDQRVELTTFSAGASDGDPARWEVGERLCLSCQFSGNTVTQITLVAGAGTEGDLATYLTWDGEVDVP